MIFDTEFCNERTRLTRKNAFDLHNDWLDSPKWSKLFLKIIGWIAQIIRRQHSLSSCVMIKIISVSFAHRIFRNIRKLLEVTDFFSGGQLFFFFFSRFNKYNFISNGFGSALGKFASLCRFKALNSVQPEPQMTFNKERQSVQLQSSNKTGLETSSLKKVQWCHWGPLWQYTSKARNRKLAEFPESKA